MESDHPHERRQGVFFTLLAVCASCFANTSVWADGPRASFNIPAGNASESLNEFLRQSGVEGVFAMDSVAGVTTKAVEGDFDAEEALAIMTEGTRLSFAIEDGRLVARSAELQGPGTAEPAAKFTKASTRGSAMEPAEAERLRSKFGDADLQQVVVTGTMIRGALDIMSPLEIVTRREMNKTPYATVQDAVQALTSNAGGAMGEDTLAGSNFVRGTAANLRGLGNGATLVLINGRRQPFSGTRGDHVDLSNIPWSAVERIEVLPDGASALYGSDAIAGVVNIIMRSDFEGSETELRAGSARGGATEKLFSQTFGTAWENGNFLAAYQYLTRSPLAAADRAYSATSDKRAFGGDDFRSFLSSPGNILDPRTGRPTHGISDSGGIVSGGVNFANRFEELDLLPGRRMHSLYMNATYEASERVEVFGEARVGAREVEYRTIPLEQVLQVPRSNPFDVNPYPQAPVALVGYSFVRDFGPSAFDVEARSYTASTGATTDIGDSWQLTASVSYGTEEMKYENPNAVDPDKLNAALADSNPATAFNAFGGVTNPLTLAGIRSTQSESARSSLTSGNVVADGTLATWSQGEIRLAAGGEWRKEQLLRGVMGVTRGNFDRSVASAFAELSVPIVGDVQRPRAAPRLELSLASRYERYSDFGTTWNPKVGIRWAPSDSLKLRTSWGTSFKAPNLYDQYYVTRNAATLVSLVDPKSPTGTSLILGLTGSNPRLDEETASTWTAGLDFVPSLMPDLQLSLTYYSIDYQDRIVVPGPTTPAQILLQEDLWKDVIARNPGPSQIAAICDSELYTGDVARCKSAPVAAIVDIRVRNLSAIAVRGVDLKIDHLLRSAFGTFQFGVNGNYVFDFQQKVSPSSPAIDALDTVGNPLAFRVRATADWYQRGWNRPGFGLNLTLDHTGGYRDSVDSGSRRVDEFESVDFRASYRTSPQGYLGDVEFALNAVNLFNERPPFVNREPGYDGINADPYGRVVSISVQKTW